jgi:hypothetical protein
MRPGLLPLDAFAEPRFDRAALTSYLGLVPGLKARRCISVEGHRSTIALAQQPQSGFLSASFAAIDGLRGRVIDGGATGRGGRRPRPTLLKRHRFGLGRSIRRCSYIGTAGTPDVRRVAQTDP